MKFEKEFYQITLMGDGRWRGKCPQCDIVSRIVSNCWFQYASLVSAAAFVAL